MVSRKWGVNYNADALSLDDILHFASLAKSAGADVLWTAEGWRDAFVPLTAIASVAKDVRVGTAVAQMARPPVLTALSALSMAEFTKGKFILGVGTAPKIWNQNWHGLDVQRPVAQIREYIECIRSILRATPNEPRSFSGTYYKVTNYVPFLTAPITDIPIYLAGVNRLMIQLAGSHTEGLILGPLNSIPYLKDTVHPNLNKGMAKRNSGACELCLTRLCAVDRDAAHARDQIRRTIAFYTVLPYYDVVLSPLGFSTQASAIRDAFMRGDYETMVRVVTDDMVAALAFAGTKDDVRAQVRQFEGLYDRLILGAPFFGVGPEETRANHDALLEVFSDWRKG
jgi:alkanesulfonate monooxygenase SsuD/methylene tetrahydromethanopterin reductase-like flavin-dependent oxidoreductase (luciferase family)